MIDPATYGANRDGPLRLEYLRRSQFIVGIAKAIRGLNGDIRRLSWIAGRKGKFKAYLETHQVRKLQLGASNNILDGWLNTDISRNHRSVVYLNAIQQFPFGNNTFDYIMAEHMIEHVDYQAAQHMLRECYRVLKPGGRVRFATPDLTVLLALHSSEKTETQKRYMEWATSQFLPGVQNCQDVFIINNFFRAWGHCFLYDQKTLLHALEDSGFKDVKFYRAGCSEDPVLRNLESHGREITEEMNQFETTVAEGSKRA